MWSTVWSGCLHGLEASLVRVEVDLQPGLPSFCIVGLPDISVRESKERVRSAIKNAQFEFPMKRITVNLVPAHLKKEGPSFDFAMAIVLLMATQQWSTNFFNDILFLGELSLKGELEPIRGVLPLVLEAKKRNFTSVFVPVQNAQEAAMAGGSKGADIHIYAIKDLLQAAQFLKKEVELSPTTFFPESLTFLSEDHSSALNFSDVKGQRWAKRALEVSAAGGHHCLMVGFPGCGKSMLAKRLPSILPPLSFEESLEVTQVYSISGLLQKQRSLILQRPFRSPHHTISYSALVGGGKQVMPGEISLAHRGVLFLDEIAEFQRDALEALREPLEERKISIARVSGRFTYPADFILLAAMNPCPCGGRGDSKKECFCGEMQVRRYYRKISGPLLDRMDMHIFVPKVSLKDLSDKKEESSQDMLERILSARKIQQLRFEKTPFYLNSQMQPNAIDQFCSLCPDAKVFLDRAMDQFGFSYRSYHRILKLSRTLADLEGEDWIRSSDIAQAFQLRFLDKQGFDRNINQS